jgi:hypothetical protein
MKVYLKGESGINVSSLSSVFYTMYVFLIAILFKGSQSLAKITSKVTAESYLHSGVNDSAVTRLGDYKVDFLGEY